MRRQSGRKACAQDIKEQKDEDKDQNLGREEEEYFFYIELLMHYLDFNVSEVKRESANLSARMKPYESIALLEESGRYLPSIPRYLTLIPGMVEPPKIVRAMTSRLYILPV